MATNSYKDLMIWQRSVELTVKIYNLTNPFPKSEMFGITSQMRRAATSVNATIAEGWERSGPKSKSYFLDVAKGSLCELESFILVSERLKFLKENDQVKILDEINQLGRMIGALRKKLIVSNSKTEE